jgi:hypothetical protein
LRGWAFSGAVSLALFAPGVYMRACARVLLTRVV